MEKSEVDSIVRDIFDLRKGSEKGKKKKTTRFFTFISGGESPLEAVQLALGRNEKLQYAQFKALTELVKFLENFNEVKLSECGDSLPSLGRILFQCNLLKVLQRILHLRLPDDHICNNIPWKIVHYCSLTALKVVVGFSKKVDHFTKTIIETDTIELLMEFADGKFDILTCYPAIHGLEALCSHSNEARERVIFSNGLSKLGHLIYKDNSQKLHVKAYEQGLELYQTNELERVCEGFVDRVHFDGSKFVGRNDISYHVLMKWSKKVQNAAGRIIHKIAEQNDRHKKLVFEDKPITKALVKWLKTPAILQGELEMIGTSLAIITTLCLNLDIATKFVNQYNIVKYLEYGVSIPHHDLHIAYASVIHQLCAVGGYPREVIGDSETIVHATVMFVFSHDKDIRDLSLKTLCKLSEIPETGNKLIQNGLTPKTLMLLTRFYDDEVGQFKTLKQALNRSASRLWKKEEAVLSKTPRELFQTLDADQSVRLKDIGNDKFKNDEYLDAIGLYSRALDVCPPAQRTKKETSDSYKWWVTPAALYSNRAQCYLKMNDWSSAYEDCSHAIARCMEDDSRASSLLTKTAYRRAKALMELGNYHEALNDVAVCMRNNYKNDDIRTLYRQILSKYRVHVGVEPIRRCAVCMEGEGEKLKRCANCSEVYCSKQCQLFGWENGHKQICNNSE